MPNGRVAFRAIDNFLEERFSCTVESTNAARLRADVYRTAQLLVWESSRQAWIDPTPDRTDRADYRFLDGEIIAIYW